MIIHLWDVGFSKTKITKLHGLGWVSMFDVGGFCRKICIQRGNGLKICVMPIRGIGIRENHYRARKGVGGFIERGK
jgi:hypothetical protein